MGDEFGINPPDGIWLIESTKSGKHITNMSYIKQLSKGVNIPDFEKLDAYSCARKILDSDEFDKLIKDGYSLMSLVTFVVGKVYEYNK